MRSLPALLIVVCVSFEFFFKGKVAATNRVRRLANATKATEQIDFMVSLENKPYWFFMPYEHVCGGTILSSFWVLSSAHCFFGKRSIDTIGYGSNDKRKLKHFDIEFVVVPNAFKEKFDPHCSCAFDEDLAVIKLKKILPVRSLDAIPTLNRYGLKPFKKAKLYSWGQNENGVYAEYLRQATFTIVSSLVTYRRDSKNIYSYSTEVALPGDSGSPLTSIDRKKLYGIHVGKMDDLSVSASTVHYGNWIMYVMYEYKDLFKDRKSRIVRCCDYMNETVYHIRKLNL